MGLRISTNVASITAQRNLVKSNERAQHAIAALSSGKRIVNAGDDAAGYAISENLRGQAASLAVAHQNAESAVGLIQVAEGGLNEQNNILIRLRELAIQSASDTVGDNERGYLNTEFTQLNLELDRIAQTTRYGDKQLLIGGDTEYVFQLGTQGTKEDTIRYKNETDTRADTLEVAGLTITDKDDARDNLKTIDEALKKIAEARAGFGAMQSRLQITSNNLDLQHENVLAARSRIADADVAQESAELMSAQVAQEFGISVLAQANQFPQRALKLIG